MKFAAAVVLALFLAWPAFSYVKVSPPGGGETKELEREIVRMENFLDVLKKTRYELSPASCAVLSEYLNHFNRKGRGVVGRKLLDRVKTEKAMQNLRKLRYALRAYFADNLKYPHSLSDLTPKYIDKIPALNPSWTNEARITVISDETTEVEEAVENSGGWIYFSNPGSPCYGLLIIDSFLKDEKGEELYKK